MDLVKEPAEANERFLRDLVAAPKAQPVNSHASVGEKVSQLLRHKERQHRIVAAVALEDREAFSIRHQRRHQGPDKLSAAH